MTTNRIKWKDFALWLRHTTSNTTANVNANVNANANEYWYQLYSNGSNTLSDVYICTVLSPGFNRFLLISHELKAHVRCARQNSITIKKKKSEKNINNDNMHRPHNPHTETTTTTVFAAPDNCNMKYHNRKLRKTLWNQKILLTNRLGCASCYPVDIRYLSQQNIYNTFYLVCNIQHTVLSYLRLTTQWRIEFSIIFLFRSTFGFTEKPEAKKNTLSLRYPVLSFKMFLIPYSNYFSIYYFMSNHFKIKF